jgi:hypothetical protein
VGQSSETTSFADDGEVGRMLHRRGPRHLSLAFLILLTACGQAEDVEAWCRGFESASKAFLGVYERIPEGTDANEAIANDPELAADVAEAARKMERLEALDPPDEIEADLGYILTTPLPHPVTSTAQERARYQEALDHLETFVREECDLDPQLVEQLNRV